LREVCSHTKRWDTKKVCEQRRQNFPMLEQGKKKKKQEKKSLVRMSARSECSCLGWVTHASP
jgi:hypothetical protein